MIRAEHITKSFDGRVVLDDISIEFLTGKTNLIIGRSGSGKTVLLKTLVGLHEPDSGDVWYDDTNFTRLDFRERRAIRKDIGMIFQGGALLDSSTVEENVKLPLDLFTSQSEKEKMERVDFCLQRVRLEDANHLYPAELSGGMIKRKLYTSTKAASGGRVPRTISCMPTTRNSTISYSPRRWPKRPSWLQSRQPGS